MKYVLEFGARGGAHVDNWIVPTLKLAVSLASNIANSYANDTMATTKQQWLPTKYDVRTVWQSPTHFVALSKLDGIPRGAASAYLWRKPHSTEYTETTIKTDVPPK